jgi:PAS domain S-box-containing protein
MGGRRMSEAYADIKKLFDGISQPALALNENGIVLFANRATAGLTTSKAASLEGKEIEKFFPGEWCENLRNSVKKTIGTGETVKFNETGSFAGKTLQVESNVFKASGCGEEGPVVLVVMTVYGPEKEADGVHGLIGGRDIGENSFLGKQVKFILGATKTNLDIIDSEFYLRYVDDSWRKIYGDPQGKKCYEYFMGRNDPCQGCGVVESMASKKTVITEEVLVKENNRVVQVTTIPFQSASGEWLYAEVNVDISRRKKMEEELRRANAFLDSIIENIPVMLFIKDAQELRFVRINRAGEELLGRRREELLGKNDYDFFPPEQADFFVQKDREAMASYDTVDVPEEFIDTKNKGRRILHTRKVPIRDENGEAAFLLGISEDATERVETEEELHRQWELLINLMDNIPFFVFWKDRDSRYLGCNKMFAKAAGVENPEFIKGKTDYDLAWEKKEADFYRKIDSEVMEKGVSVLNIEESQLQSDGKRAVVLTSKVPLKDACGNIIGVLGIFTDITERKETEERLKLFRDLIDQSSDALFIINAKTGAFLDVNDQACSSLGYTREEFLGMRVPDIEARLKDEEEWKEHLKAMEASGSMVFRGEHIRKGGEVLPVEVNLRYVKVAENPYIIAVARDLSERMGMERMLRDSEKKYRTIFENTGTITAIVDESRDIIMANGEFARFFGVDPESLEKTVKIDELVYEEDLEKVRNYHRLRRIDPGSVPNSYELRMIDRSGHIRATYITVAIIPGTDSSVLSLSDLTELKEKEAALEKQRDILDSTNRVLEHKIAELSEAATHIRKLEGLVPICSSCKKIMRTGTDPKKEESWVNIEKYISEKTEASFTHGLCPECISRLYGNYLSGKKKKGSGE